MNMSSEVATYKRRVIRGGATGNGGNNALSSFRHWQNYDNTSSTTWGGFRLTCPVPTL